MFLENKIIIILLFVHLSFPSDVKFETKDKWNNLQQLLFELLLLSLPMVVKSKEGDEGKLKAYSCCCCYYSSTLPDIGLLLHKPPIEDCK